MCEQPPDCEDLWVDKLLDNLVQNLMCEQCLDPKFLCVDKRFKHFCPIVEGVDGAVFSLLGFFQVLELMAFRRLSLRRFVHSGFGAGIRLPNGPLHS